MEILTTVACYVLLSRWSLFGAQYLYIHCVAKKVHPFYYYIDKTALSFTVVYKLSL